MSIHNCALDLEKISRFNFDFGNRNCILELGSNKQIVLFQDIYASLLKNRIGSLNLNISRLDQNNFKVVITSNHPTILEKHGSEMVITFRGNFNLPDIKVLLARVN